MTITDELSTVAASVGDLDPEGCRLFNLVGILTGSGCGFDPNKDLRKICFPIKIFFFSHDNLSSAGT
jgi:hypothetical protein